jgi:hypothetical protein
MPLLGFVAVHMPLKSVETVFLQSEPGFPGHEQYLGDVF